MRIWNSYKDVETSVKAIIASMKQTGELPAIMVAAYRKTLQMSYRGVVQHFYELIAEQCPQALKYFAGLDVDPAEGKEE